MRRLAFLVVVGVAPLAPPADAPVAPPPAAPPPPPPAPPAPRPAPAPPPPAPPPQLAPDDPLRAELARQGAAIDELRQSLDQERKERLNPAVRVSGFIQADWVIHNQESQNEVR